MKWAHDNSYELYGLEETGRWDFRGAGRRIERGAPVCVDVLYFKSFDTFLKQQPTLSEVIAYSLILDLWGFSSRALHLLDLYGDQAMVADIRHLIGSHQRTALFSKHKLNDVLDKCLVRLGLTPKFPPIHD